ncbi:MAG: hypothetical protein NT096_12830 [Proteobacteria bacterium]|nr:hypothetical protein [Pseudomonadota bacterium]
MADPEKKFTYENGLRFEVTLEGLFYSPENTHQEKNTPALTVNSASGVQIHDAPFVSNKAGAVRLPIKIPELIVVVLEQLFLDNNTFGNEQIGIYFFSQ